MWLSDAPPVLEECAQAATQPQLLKILLEHQTCLGHLEAAGRTRELPSSSKLLGSNDCRLRKLLILHIAVFSLFFFFFFF